MRWACWTACFHGSPLKSESINHLSLTLSHFIKLIGEGRFLPETVRKTQMLSENWSQCRSIMFNSHQEETPLAAKRSRLSRRYFPLTKVSVKCHFQSNYCTFSLQWCHWEHIEMHFFRKQIHFKKNLLNLDHNLKQSKLFNNQPASRSLLWLNTFKSVYTLSPQTQRKLLQNILIRCSITF